MTNNLLIRDTRQEQIRIAYELLHNNAHCFWTEGSNRWSWRDQPTLTFPFYGDCSSTVTAISFFAGGNDPSGLDFAYGNTKTMLAHAEAKNLIIVKSKLIPGDYVLLGDASLDATPDHVAFALQYGTNKNPLFFSMGKQGDPSIASLTELLTIGPAMFVRNVTRVNSNGAKG